jgi:YebC/PmpR family DNA-binding regulatory protein
VVEVVVLVDVDVVVVVVVLVVVDVVLVVVVVVVLVLRVVVVDVVVEVVLVEVEDVVLVEVVYEAYGPGGAAFIIEGLTDNKNRTLTNVKTILDKNGGRFAGSGSVMWMFERKGVVVAGAAEGGAFPDAASLENLELELIDQGAEDFSASGEHLQVITDVSGWSKVRDFLKGKGMAIESAGLQFVPKQYADIDAAGAQKVDALREKLEEDDDVSEVHTNARVQG